MNAGTSRCWRRRRSMTTPSTRARAMASSTSPPVPAAAESKTHVAFLFVPRSAWTRSAPSSIARSMSSTAGSSS